uniref:Ionotropic glutamate receptor C-terminal domain-containing protein n=1 Tax=Anopheles farauti TaxID=69004 RepID=A0A182Q1L0_9DIPT
MVAHLDLALFLVRCGMTVGSPSADAALDVLAYLTARPAPFEGPAAGQELCISPPDTGHHYWNDVLERYLVRVREHPRVLSRTKLGAVALPLCSLYLIFEPDAHARQVFIRLQFLSTNQNWNQVARFAVMVNRKQRTGELYNQFENFGFMGIRNGLVLMSVPEHNRTFTLVDDDRRALDYAMVVEDVPQLLANRARAGLGGRRVTLSKRTEFPFLLHERGQYVGVYDKFFKEFANHYRCPVVYRDSDVDVVPAIHTRETLARPLAIGSFTGNCLVVPERPKEGLIFFLLSPFSTPLWGLCCCVLLLTFWLNWQWARRFPNSILLTVLFGDQAPDDRYAPSERRLTFIAVVMMFFFSEAYSAKLLSTFIESLNRPRIRTVEALAASDIPLGVLHFADVADYEQLHRNLLVVDEPEYYDNLRHGRHAFMVECGNAELFVQMAHRSEGNGLLVPYYVLDEFVGWRMNGFAVSKYSPVAGPLLAFSGIVAQAGLWEYWRECYVQKLRNMANRDFTQRETLNLHDLISLRYVLAGLVLLSVATVADPVSGTVTELNTLHYVTTQSERLEIPAAGQELCISSSGTDPHWNEVLERYLLHFAEYPRLLATVQFPHAKLHRCSMYLVFEPTPKARQIFQRMMSISSSANWNAAANLILLTDWIDDAQEMDLIFRVFLPHGVRNMVLVQTNRHRNVSAVFVSNYRGMIQQTHVGSPLYSLLVRDRNRNIDRFPLVLEKKTVFPFLMFNSRGAGGIMHFFFEAFVKHVNGRLKYGRVDNHFLLGIRLHSPLSTPLPVGGFTGNCLLVPDKPKQSMIHYLLAPFSSSLWCLCCALVAFSCFLNCQWSRHLPNNILLTVLFGSQATGTFAIERRLILVASVIMFFLSESYSAKLISMFVQSLNEPHLKTVRQFVESGITLELMNYAPVEVGKELRQNVLISDKQTYIENVNRSQNAIMMECGNAKLLLHEMLNMPEGRFPGRYYILPEFVGSRMNGLRVSKYTAVGLQLQQFAGWFLQAGLWDYWAELYNEKMQLVLHRSSSHREILHMVDLASLHYLLLVGYTLSYCLCLEQQPHTIFSTKINTPRTVQTAIVT